MKKKIWSLLLALIMIFTMIPPTTYQAAENLGFFYAVWNNNFISENTNLGYQNTLYSRYGMTQEIFVYYEDEQGNRTRVYAKDITSSNPNIIKVSPSRINGDATSIEAVGVGQTTLEYKVGGKTLQLVVNSTLPEVACYSSQTANISNYLHSFKITKNSKTFYVVSDGNWNIEKVVLPGQLSGCATVTVDASKKFATVTITGTPNLNGNEMCNIECELSDPSGQMSSIKMYTLIELVNEEARLMASWPDYSGSKPVKPQNPQWYGSLWKLNPGNRIPYYFAIIENGKEIANITDIVSSDSSIIKVTKVKNSPAVQLEAFSAGTVTLTGTYGGQTYTMQATVELPDVAAYTSKTPSGPTLIYDGFRVGQVGDEFYVISLNGYTLDSVTLNGALKGCANVSFDNTKTIATIKFTKMPTSFGLTSFSYKATNQSTGGTISENYQIGLVYAAPQLQFIHQKDNGSSILDRINGTQGGQTEGYFSFSDKAGERFIPLSNLKSTNEKVVKISSANDSKNPDKILVEFVGEGDAKIVYTDSNGATHGVLVYVEAEAPKLGFFTQNHFNEANRIENKFTATDANNIFYLVSSGAELSNVKLIQGTESYATVEVISKTCIKITITDKINNVASNGSIAQFTISYDVKGAGNKVESLTIVNNFTNNNNNNNNNTNNNTCTHANTEYTGTKAPSCTEAGTTGDVVCKDCQAVVQSGTAIPATGHAFVNSACTACGEKTVVADTVDKVDTSKPVTEVTPVINQAAADVTIKDVTTVVDAVINNNVTTEMKDAVSEDTLNKIKNEIAAGNQITTEIKAEVITEATMDAAAVQKIKDKLGEAGKVAQFLDLSVLIKSVGADGTEKDLGTLNALSEKITFTLMVPADFIKDGREFYVIRVHEGVAEKLDLTKNADGTYAFETDKFSSYALAYDEATGSDSNAWLIFVGVAAVAVVGVAVVWFIKKRKAEEK